MAQWLNVSMSANGNDSNNYWKHTDLSAVYYYYYFFIYYY